MEIQKNLRLLTLQYELTMLIGHSLNLQEMLEFFLPKTLAYLNCATGHIWLLNKDTNLMEHSYSYPRVTTMEFNILQKMVNQFFKNKKSPHVKSLEQPLHSYFINIGAVGIAVLQSHKPLSKEILTALKPIFNRLSLACLACLQYSLTESSYRDIFEHSPISLWEEDFSVVKRYLSELQTKGIENLDRYFIVNPKEVEKCASMVKINSVNLATLKMYGAHDKAEMMKNLSRIFGKKSLEVFRNELVAYANNETSFKAEGITYTLDHKKVHITINCSVAPGYEKTYGKVLVSIMDISDLKLAEARLEYLAKHDELTGLSNRILFNMMLERAINRAVRSGQIMAVLSLDLDHFKNINDTLGHDIGDLLLIEVAKKLQKAVRADDFVARYGGDEFAIILNGLTNVHDAGNIAKKFNDTIKDSYKLAKHTVHISTSIGIACYPSEGENATTLLKHADIALYAAKDAGRNTYKYFTPNLNGYHTERLFIENALEHALERHELYLVYQPKFALPSKKIIGMETLLRWQHPELGLVLPTKFIPIAETTGVVVPIGKWVLKTACQQFAEHFSQQKNDQLLAISLNVSPEQFIRADFLDLIANIIEKTKIPAKNIELELPETLIMSKVEISEQVLMQLNKIGVKISIDNFGAGYSSLSCLKHLPITNLKINQSFIRDIETDPNDAIIVKSIINLAKNLELNVIAEGVETKEQLQFLIDNGCPQAQGFYLAKPLKIDEVVRFIKKHTDRQ
ncbi:MAG: bifunctional diguanylate cyclase/phosphodiesterase [Gammaproteobacteria bacterium]|jgi:diguanylate cyclase (GGDEF)-like protein